jgi:hypothetical protein
MPQGYLPECYNKPENSEKGVSHDRYTAKLTYRKIAKLLNRCSGLLCYRKIGLRWFVGSGISLFWSWGLRK